MVYLLSYVMGLIPVLEQPLSSVLAECLSMKTVLEFSSSRRYVTYMGAFAGPSQKPLQLWSPFPCVSFLQRSKPDMVASEPLVRRHGDQQFTGHKQALAESQEYTCTFGSAVAQMCQAEWSQ